MTLKYHALIRTSNFTQMYRGSRTDIEICGIGDLDFCEWRDVLIQAVFTATDTDRTEMENQQLESRMGRIVSDFSSGFEFVEAEDLTRLVEDVLKPAYVLHRAMQTSRTAYCMIWPRSSHRQPLTQQALTMVAMRDIKSSQILDPEEVTASGRVVNGLHDLHPSLSFCEQGSKLWEPLVTPVLLTE